jgi:large subunit ribosomal protein L25
MARKELSVDTREVTGKKVAQLRRSGVLPGNVYGRGLQSIAIQIDKELMEKTLKASAANEVIDLRINGERDTRPVIIQKVQRHPLNSATLHAEFYQVSLTTKMHADVPLVLVGDSDAVSTYNGVLVTALETVRVEALPLDVPPTIEVDVTPLTELEQAIFVRDLNVPSNVSVLTDPDVMVVKVASPRVAEEEEEVAPEEGVEAAEGEEAAEAPEAAEEGEAEASSEEG